MTQARVRLDRVVHDWLGGRVGRRSLAAILAAGDVRVNGRRALKGIVLRRGDEVVIHALPAPRPSLVPEAVALPIVHLDDAVVVVDKPPGLPSTAGRSGAPSVAAALLYRFPEMAAIDPRHAAGLVHRLDTGTSGVLVAARTEHAHGQLRAAFVHRLVAKEYLAVVRGTIAAPGTLAHPLRRHPRSRGRMVPARTTSGAWQALTEFTPLCTAPGLTLIRLRMRTGVTHQLRVHMAMLGHPIVGDVRYGGLRDAPGSAPELSPEHDRPGWHYLHAREIRVEVPGRGAAFTTPFPAHWRPLFARLGWPESVAAGVAPRSA